MCVCRRPRELLRQPQRRSGDSLRGAWYTDEESPQGNELKAPFGELVVTGRRQMAARADCGRALARSHSYFDALLVGSEAGLLINKSLKAVAAVQNCDQFHGAEASGLVAAQSGYGIYP